MFAAAAQGDGVASGEWARSLAQGYFMQSQSTSQVDNDAKLQCARWLGEPAFKQWLQNPSQAPDKALYRKLADVSRRVALIVNNPRFDRQRAVGNPFMQARTEFIELLQSIKGHLTQPNALQDLQTKFAGVNDDFATALQAIAAAAPDYAAIANAYIDASVHRHTARAEEAQRIIAAAEAAAAANPLQPFALPHNFPQLRAPPRAAGGVVVPPAAGGAGAAAAGGGGGAADAAALAASQQQVTQLQLNKQHMQGKLDTAQADLAACQKLLAQERATASAAGGGRGYDTEVTALRDEVAQLKNDVGRAKRTEGELRAELARAVTTADGLKTDLAAARAASSGDTQTTVASLQQTIVQLRTDLDASKVNSTTVTEGLRRELASATVKLTSSTSAKIAIENSLTASQTALAACTAARAIDATALEAAQQALQLAIVEGSKAAQDLSLCQAQMMAKNAACQKAQDDVAKLQTLLDQAKQIVTTGPQASALQEKDAEIANLKTRLARLTARQAGAAAKGREIMSTRRTATGDAERGAGGGGGAATAADVPVVPAVDIAMDEVAAQLGSQQGAATCPEDLQLIGFNVWRPSPKVLVEAVMGHLNRVSFAGPMTADAICSALAVEMPTLRGVVDSLPRGAAAIAPVDDPIRVFESNSNVIFLSASEALAQNEKNWTAGGTMIPLNARKLIDMTTEAAGATAGDTVTNLEDVQHWLEDKREQRTLFFVVSLEDSAKMLKRGESLKAPSDAASQEWNPTDFGLPAPRSSRSAAVDDPPKKPPARTVRPIVAWVKLRGFDAADRTVKETNLIMRPKSTLLGALLGTTVTQPRAVYVDVVATAHNYRKFGFASRALAAAFYRLNDLADHFAALQVAPADEGKPQEAGDMLKMVACFFSKKFQFQRAFPIADLPATCADWFYPSDVPDTTPGSLGAAVVEWDMAYAKSLGTYDKQRNPLYIVGAPDADNLMDELGYMVRPPFTREFLSSIIAETPKSERNVAGAGAGGGSGEHLDDAAPVVPANTGKETGKRARR